MVESASSPAASAAATREQLWDELDQLTEAELESVVANEPAKADDARFVLGRLCVEGTSGPDRVPPNETKGMNWIKTAAKNGHVASIEYQTYYNIRFDRHPNLKKIMQGLETVVA